MGVRIGLGVCGVVMLTLLMVGHVAAQDLPVRVDRVPISQAGEAAPDVAKDPVAKKASEDEAKKKEAEEGYVVGSDRKLAAIWNNGLWLESQHKDFRVHVGGRVQPDWIWYSAPQNVQFARNGTGRIDDAFAVRRARFAIEGTLYEVFSFNLEYDFMNTANVERVGAPLVIDTPVPTDLYVQVSYLPIVGNLRIGNQKPPISFEHLTSSRFLNFMERSYAFDAFIGGPDNGFQPGFQVFNTLLDDRVSWAVGGFKTNNTIFSWNTGDGEWNVVTRLTGTPVYEAEGRRLIHLGVAYNHRDLDDKIARFRARTELRNGPAALHTPLGDVSMIGTGEELLVPEFVAQSGPFVVQSEFFAAWVHNATVPVTPPAARVNQGTSFFYSWYVEGLVFLTGEHRKYDTKYPRFDRVVPFENFFLVRSEDGGTARGWGAWQLALRYSYINLNDRGITGGVHQSITAGVNWFWNPNMKVQWNYTVEHRNAPDITADGFIHGFGTRLALDF